MLQYLILIRIGLLQDRGQTDAPPVTGAHAATRYTPRLYVSRSSEMMWTRQSLPLVLLAVAVAGMTDALQLRTQQLGGQSKQARPMPREAPVIRIVRGVLCDIFFSILATDHSTRISACQNFYPHAPVYPAELNRRGNRNTPRPLVLVCHPAYLLG